MIFKDWAHLLHKIGEYMSFEKYVHRLKKKISAYFMFPKKEEN